MNVSLSWVFNNGFRLKYQLSILVIGLLGVHVDLSAKQLSFSRTNTENEWFFSYQWRDAKSDAHNLSFSISNIEFNKMPESAPAFNNRRMQDSISSALLGYAKTVDPRLAKIEIKHQTNELSFEVTSNSEQRANDISNELTRLHKKAQQAFLGKNLLTESENHFSQPIIRQDHSRYVNLSYSSMKTIVAALKKQLANPYDVREFIELTLSWVQSIPYNEIEDRSTSNGSGFASPKQILLHNKGDCDSKSVFISSIIKAYNPNIQQRIVYLPNHALLGVQLKPKKQDKHIYVDNRPFVLFEPTGPALYSIGQISPTSSIAIGNNQMTSEEI